MYSGSPFFPHDIKDKNIIKINKKFFRPAEVNFLKGNYKRALNKLGWRPKTNFKNLIKIMIDEELKNNY